MERIRDRLFGNESKARAERLRRSQQAGEYIDDFMGEGALVEVNGQLCVRALTIEEKAARAKAALMRLPKCLKSKTNSSQYD